MNDRIADKREVVAAGPVAAPDDGKPALGRAENVPRGIIMMIVATFLFASASAASKWLVDIYPLGETIFIRSLSSLITAAAIILPINGLSVYATRRPRDHILRGMSQTISQVCLLIAFSLMPLAGAMAISFSAPLFAALVSILWLGERAGWVRGSALLIGFGGVLIVTNPGANSSDDRGCVRADQRRDVRHSHDSGTRHGPNRVSQYARDLAAYCAHFLSQLSFVLRLALADPASRRADVWHRLYQCDRAMVSGQDHCILRLPRR